MAKFRQTDLMKKSKTFSAMVFPVSAYKSINVEDLYLALPTSKLAGMGYVTYDTREQRINTMLFNESGEMLPMDYYNLEIDYEKGFLVVTTEVIQ